MNILLRLLAAHPHHVHVFIFYMADLADKVEQHQENMHVVRVFIFYMADLADKVKHHQENMHAYADDTQLYLHCCLNDTAAAITWLVICLDDVSTGWPRRQPPQVERREDRITVQR